MSNPANLVLSISSLLRLISIPVALWLASRFEPRVGALLQGEGTSRLGTIPRTVIWLALGAVFAIPLFDLVTLLHQFVELFAPASWGLANGTFTAFWGAASPRVFDALSAGTTLVFYTVASLILWRSFGEQPSSSLAHLAPASADRILLALAFAGLVNLIVSSILVGVVFVQLPTAAQPLGFGVGVVGFVAAWLVGLLLVLAMVLWMHMHFQPTDAEA